MNIVPIDDNNSVFENVILTSSDKSIKNTPHCILHGAMNKVAVFKDKKISGIWRCCTSEGITCRSGCIQLED